MATTSEQHPTDDCPEAAPPCERCTTPSHDNLLEAERAGYDAVAKMAAQWAAETPRPRKRRRLRTWITLAAEISTIVALVVVIVQEFS